MASRWLWTVGQVGADSRREVVGWEWEVGSDWLLPRTAHETYVCGAEDRDVANARRRRGSKKATRRRRYS